MATRAPAMEWYQCDTDEDWMAAIASAPALVQEKAAPYAAFVSRWRVRLAGILALALIMAGVRILQQADQEMTRVENEVRSVAAAEAWANPGAPAHQHAMLAIAPAPVSPSVEITHGPGVEVGRVEVRDDYAMVEVLVTESDLPWLPAPYRQTRFYRETEQDWLPTEPADAFWQPLNTLGVGRFTVVYGRRDADAVMVASRQLEQADADLRAVLGLPPTGEPLTIKLMSAGLPRLDPTVLAQWSDGSTLYAPSPALLPLPVHMSEAEALLQLFAGLLVQHTVDEALAGSSQACQWRGLADGVQRWLLWERSDLPSQDRTNGAQFLQDYQVRHGGARPVRFGPNHYACATDPYARKLRTNYMADSMATAFVEYVVSAYGRDRLPILLDGMQRYDTWEDLIQGVYSLSVVDFEAIWRHQLRKDGMSLQSVATQPQAIGPQPMLRGSRR